MAEIAALVGDPARANILFALMDGRALTAKELAYAARVAPSTASAHLAALTGAGLLTCKQQGRHRYYRLACSLVGSMLESILAVAAQTGPPVRRETWRGGEALRTRGPATITWRAGWRLPWPIGWKNAAMSS